MAAGWDGVLAVCAVGGHGARTGPSAAPSEPAAGSVAADECPDSLTQQGTGDVSRLSHAEDAHGQTIVAAQGEGGGVDHLEAVGQGSFVGELVEALGLGVLAGVGGVDAINPVLATSSSSQWVSRARWAETVSVEK